MAQPAPANNTQILRYPLRQIKSMDDYLQVDIIEYVPPGIETINPNSFSLRGSDESLSESKKKPLVSIILPIPEGINDANSASWGEATMGPGEVAAATIADSVINGRFKDIGNKAQAGLNAVLDPTGRKNVNALMANLAARALVGTENNINSYLSRATGTVTNPNNELLFNNTTATREFSFIFDIVPRSKKESDEIKSIIRRLKYHMTPSRGNESQSGGGLFIKAPDVFQLSYKQGKNPHPFLNLFKPMALVTMGVDYTGSGTYATYSDATPVHMRLSLGFKELSPIFKENYNPYGGETATQGFGVGY